MLLLDALATCEPYTDGKDGRIERVECKAVAAAAVAVTGQCHVRDTTLVGCITRLPFFFFARQCRHHTNVDECGGG